MGHTIFNVQTQVRQLEHEADARFPQRQMKLQSRFSGSISRTGERDSVPEPPRKKVRFAERVEEQTFEGTVVANSRSTSSSSSSSSSSSDSSSSPHAIATSMQVDESNQDSSKKDRKLPMVLIWSWKGWSWNLSGIVFNDTLTVIF